MNNELKHMSDEELMMCAVVKMIENIDLDQKVYKQKMKPIYDEIKHRFNRSVTNK